MFLTIGEVANENDIMKDLKRFSSNNLRLFIFQTIFYQVLKVCRETFRNISRGKSLSGMT